MLKERIYKRANLVKIYLQIFGFTGTLHLLLKSKFSKAQVIILTPKDIPHEIKIRNHPTDINVARYVLYEKYHIPFEGSDLPQNSVIVDLGSNTGLTIAHFKSKYPSARVIGYEMDAQNIELAKWNTQFCQNVELINKAIWIENKKINYSKNFVSDSYTIQNQIAGVGCVEVQAITMRELIRAHAIRKIDFLKIDIEGAEKALLRDPDKQWLDIVEAINIEMHLEKEERIEDFIDILISKGFVAWKDKKHHSAIMGYKKRN